MSGLAVSLVIPLLLLLAVIPLVIALVRANELFVVRAAGGGRIRVVRGRVPQALVNEIADILATIPDHRVTLRAVSEDGRVRFYPSGEPLSEVHKQRLRNVAGAWPVVRVRNG